MANLLHERSGALDIRRSARSAEFARTTLLIVLLVLFLMSGPEMLGAELRALALRNGLQSVAPWFVDPLVPRYLPLTVPQLALGLALTWALMWHRLQVELGLRRPMHGGVTDRPAQSLSDDALNRKPLAQAIAALLLNPHSSAPFTIALTAPWGSGKTSVLNFTGALLRERAGIIPLNPWHFREEGHMFAALLTGIRSTAVPRGFSFRTLRFRTRLAWFRLSPTLLPAVAVFAAIVAGLASIGRLPSIEAIAHAVAVLANDAVAAACTPLRCSSLLADWLGPTVVTGAAGFSVWQAAKAIYGKLRTFTPEFEKLLRSLEGKKGEPRSVDWTQHAGLRFQFQHEFSTLCAALGTGGWLHRAAVHPGVVLLIDDVDRCEPAQIEVVVATVNFLLDSPAACFAVMAMDWDKVVAALSVHFREVATAEGSQAGKQVADARGFAERYLEKIVQLRIDIGAPSPPLSALVLAAPENALSVINWWALPWRLTELLSRLVIGAAGTLIEQSMRAARRVGMAAAKTGTWITQAIDTVAARLRRGDSSDDTDSNVTDERLRTRRVRWYVTIGFGIYASLSVVIAASLGVGLNFYEIERAIWLAIAVVPCLLLPVAAVRGGLRYLAERLARSNASAQLSLVAIPLLLYVYLSTDNSVLALMALCYFLFSLALTFVNIEDAQELAQEKLERLVCYFVILSISAAVAGPAFLRAAVTLVSLYLIVASLSFFWAPADPRFSRHMAKATSLGFLYVASAFGASWALVRRLCKPDGLALMAVLAGLLVFAASQPLPPEAAVASQTLQAPATGRLQPSGDAHELLILASAFVFILLLVAIVVIAGRSGWFEWFDEHFFRTSDPEFESSLAALQPRFSRLGLTPRAEKQLVNRARFVLTRWHVECNSPEVRWNTLLQRIDKRMRAWLNSETWTVVQEPVVLGARVVSELCLLNALALGRLAAADRETIQQFLDSPELSPGALAVLKAALGESDSPLAVAQWELWRSYEAALPTPRSWEKPSDSAGRPQPRRMRRRNV